MKYIAIIHKEPESDFGVSFPDFPGCVTAGLSYEEAKTMARESLEIHIEGMKEDGETLPYPTSMAQVMNDPDFSDGAAFYVEVDESLQPKLVRVNISIPEDRLKSIDEKAKSSGMSRSAFIIEHCS